jgi:hypothetical protein
MQSGKAVSFSIWNWVFVPFVITLAVTVIRLLGELNRWSHFWFNPEPGGGFAPIGISWLVPCFGLYFGWKLAREGHRPASALRQVVGSVGGIALLILATAAASAARLSLPWMEVVLAIVSIASVYVAYRPWPMLGKIHLAYGLASRAPVALLMLFAIYGNWGTHYDVAPAGFPEMGPFSKWALIGFLPQMTTWMVYTVAIGGLFGIGGARLARTNPRPGGAQSVDA